MELLLDDIGSEEKQFSRFCHHFLKPQKNLVNELIV